MKLRTWVKRIIPSIILLLAIGGAGLGTTSCSPKVCPANDRPIFNKKRARYSTINHMKRRGGKGMKKRRTKTREPKMKFFKTKFNKRQFKHQTK